MGKAGMDTIMLSEWVNLCFSIQLTKALGKYNSVVIFVEWASGQFCTAFFYCLNELRKAIPTNAFVPLIIIHYEFSFIMPKKR